MMAVRPTVAPAFVVFLKKLLFISSKLYKPSVITEDYAAHGRIAGTLATKCH